MLPNKLRSSRRSPQIFHTALLAGVSVLSLLAAGSPAHAKGSLTIGSGSYVAPVTTATDQAMVGAEQAQAMALRSQNSLSRVTQALAAMQAAQTAARNLVLDAPDTVPSGLTTGGLQVDPRVNDAVAAGASTDLWVNASQPTQTTANGQTTVTIDQTAQNAVMTWLTYNVSKTTTVVYNQQGNTDWVALNRIDATGVPSEIEGQIQASGTVLLIDPNGVIFTGSSQINVQSLIATSLDIDGTAAASAFNGNPTYSQITDDGVTFDAPPNEEASNAYFVANGLYTIPSGTGTTGYSVSFVMGNQTLSSTGRGAIVVQPGASITTSVDATGDGGYVALLGSSVTNDGSITTQDGEIILAADNATGLTDPSSTATGVDTAISVGAGVISFPAADLVALDPAEGDGQVTNNGLLLSYQGNVTATGLSLSQQGVVEATTSTQRIGSITLDAIDAATFGPNSVTTILPDANSGTVPAVSATGLAPVITITGSTGVDFQSGSLVEAPSAALSLSGNDVVLEDGATINLAGLANVDVPVSDFFVTFVVTANEVANTPLAESLIGTTVTIDTRLTGTNANGVSWVGSPIVDATGYAEDIEESIDEILTAGGSITTSGNNFIQMPGSVIDISGGYITYTGTAPATTRLEGSDGHLYDIGSANPDITYAGIAGQFTVDDAYWGVTQSYGAPLLSMGTEETGYIAGASAGALSITGIPALDGTIIGDTVSGEIQKKNAQGGGATAQNSLSDLPEGAALTISGGNNVLLETSAQAGSDPYGLSSYVFGSSWTAPGTVPLLTDALSDTGFASITIKGANTVNMAAGAVLTVADGGSVNLSSVETIDGTINAPSGKITLSGFSGAQTGGVNLPPATALTIGPDAVLNVAGLWVNDAGETGDDLQGSAFINGGSVNISTVAMSYSVDGGTNPDDIQDVTQSIILSPGSVIDVSGGGYVSTAGKLTGGEGGNLSLQTYSSGGVQRWTGINSSIVFVDVYNTQPTGGNEPDAATVVMDGTIDAESLSDGGTFTLQAPTITIDGTAASVTSYTSGANAGEIVLPASFFTSGFSDYVLTSTYGSTTVTAGTKVDLQQTNYLIDSTALSAPSGTNLADIASIGILPDGLSDPVSLTLAESGYAYGTTGPSTTAGVLIEDGASIVADATASAQATINLTAYGPVTVLGSIIAPGGTIDVTAGSSDGENTVASTDVWIGADAVLDVSGVYVPDPLVTAYQTGSVLNGGSVTLSGLTVVALPGSQFLLDGTAATIQTPTGSDPGDARYAPDEIWSNGGTLDLGTDSIYFAGTVSASGGAPLASGGTLIVNSSVVIEPAGLIASSLASAGATSSSYPLTPTALAAVLPSAAGAFIGVDTLNQSGFESVTLNAGGTGVVAFNGSESVDVPGSLILSGGGISLLPSSSTLLPTGVTNPSNYTAPSCTPAGACIPTIGGTTVDLTAGYLWLVGNSYQSVKPSLADGTLNVTAQWIDIGSPNNGVGSLISLQNVGTANFTSTGAIRLIGWQSGGDTTNVYTGGLYAAGNLTLTAAEIYPVSGTSFVLYAGKTLTIGQTGTASEPESAGGTVILDAANINQDGTLWAPFGQIIIGLNSASPYDSTFTSITGNGLSYVTTQNVTLGDGSLTSVSGAGELVPYGYTVDGQTWYVGNTYYTGIYAASELTASPTQAITLSGADVTTDSGAVLDLSGGGDIYAAEFVSGTGGTVNVLTGSNVYALVPTSSAEVADYDPTISGGIFATSTTPTLDVGNYATAPTTLAGTAITIAGGDGIPAGTYVLMPGMYATLPGAYRVTVASTGANQVTPLSYVGEDGSIYLTGYFSNAITGAQSSQAVLFEIQPQSTWSKYSDITITSGTSFITSLAAAAGTAVPTLPIDGGILTLAATNALSTSSTNTFAAGTSPLDPTAVGAGGQVDITAADILVLAPDQTAPAADTGYLVLNSNQVSDLGASTVIIGGTSSINASGELALAGIATNLEVDTDAANPLSGPQLILITTAGGTGITVDSGSVISAVGSVPAGNDQAITVTGDGSLLRVSNGEMVTVIRSGATADDGSILIGTLPGTTTLASAASAAATTIDGGEALTIDSSGNSGLGVNVTLAANAYDLTGSIINIGGGTAGLVLTDAELAGFAGASSVLLQSASVINLYDAGGLTIGDASDPIGTLTFNGAGLYSQGGTTTINASNIVLTDSQSTPNTTGALAGTNGTLTLNAAGTITPSAGTFVLGGFGQINLQASDAVDFSGSGALTASNGSGVANILISTPDIVALAGSSQALTTSGSLTIVSTGAAQTVADTEISGSLGLTAANITDSGTLTALGGDLSLIATGGDITLGNGAVINAAGTQITLGPVTEDTPGGTVSLVSETGNVTLNGGSLITVAASGSGYAGTLEISTADTGTTTLDGTLDASAAFGDSGGSFTLSTGSIAGALPLTSGFSSNFEVEIYQPGDLTIAAGQTLTSGNVLLVANQGSVIIDGTINASSPTGGIIQLYGAGVTDSSGNTTGGVTINSGAQLLAEYLAPASDDPNYANGTSTLTEDGGTITLGTTGYWNGTSLNADGSELITPAGSGTITVEPGVIINVSGGAGGTGGVIDVRAPITTDASGNSGVNVSFYEGGSDTVTGASALDLNAYEAWSTTDPSTGAQHFDGIIDPAGWYTSSGTLEAGAFYNAAGIEVATWNGSTLDSLNGASTELSYYLTNDYFTPSTYNTNDETFYGYVDGNTADGVGTLMGFIENPFNGTSVGADFGSGVQSVLVVQPEVDLVNPSTTINDGNISVLTNWNLAGGSVNAGTGALTQAYRYNGEAPVIVLRTANDVNIDASITDGFVGETTVAAVTGDAYDSALDLYDSDVNTFNLSTIKVGTFGSIPTTDDFQAPDTPVVLDLTGSDPTSVYYTDYESYIAAYAYYYDDDLKDNSGYFSATGTVATAAVTSDLATAEAAYSSTDLASYTTYITDYNTYSAAYYSWSIHPAEVGTLPVAPLPPPALATVAYSAPSDAISPVATATNPSPITVMNLAAEASSSSYDFIAGAVFNTPNIASVDPNAVITLPSSTTVNAANPTDSVTIGGNTAYTDPEDTAETVYVPTLVRTGTGSITLTAAGNVEFTDSVVQGAVYTAGTATTTPSDFTAASLSSGYATTPDGLISEPEWGTGGGSVTIDAGGSIIGIAATETSSGAVTTESVDDWYYRYGDSNGSATPFSNCSASVATCQNAAWVNYATFFDNFGALGGGNVTLKAGGNITDISASLPETFVVAGGTSSSDPAHIIYYGGGDLLVEAGGNLNSSTFFVGDGSAFIDVGGAVGATTYNPITDSAESASALQLYVQDGYVNLIAAGAVDLASLEDPATLTLYGGNDGALDYVNSLTPVSDELGGVSGNNGYWGAFLTTYSPEAGLSLTSLDGNVTALSSNLNASSSVLSVQPGSLSIAALLGGITIGGADLFAYPTDDVGDNTGALTLAAAGSIDTGDLTLGALADETGVPAYSANNITEYVNPLGLPSYTYADADLATSAPVVVYAGQNISGTLGVDRPADIQAGEDISSLTFTGVNLNADDVTSIVAGQDIDYPSIGLGGPGDLLIEAGRNIEYPNISTASTTESATITMLYGVGPGVDYAAAIADYVDPAQAGTDGIDFLTYIAATLGETPADAWTTFEGLSTTKQELLVDQAFLNFVTQVVPTDYNDASSTYYGQYARAYTAIETLFPASYGYTNDAAGTAANGAEATVTTGNLLMPLDLIETQEGGDINIIAPGGGIQVGTDGRDTLKPNQEGILTLAGGSINIFTDQSVELGQSRIMTEQGGDINIFSANGNINAGSGPKTYVSSPILSEICDDDGYCYVNPQGLVTGAGIAAVVSLPGQNPDLSNVTLVAPHGTVDAGAAGIRVAGNLNIIALHVLNAYNIQVGGTTTGVSSTVAPNIGALTTAGNASGAAAAAASGAERQPTQNPSSVFIIEILGYGGGDGTDDQQQQQKKKPSVTQASYNPNSAVQFVGLGNASGFQ